MAKKMKNSNDMSCSSMHGCGCVSSWGFSAALILIGAAYALQYSNILFTNVVLWPWVLITIGICAHLFRKR
ncbi:hypothetical protein HYT56_01105 [Candidatus Woesearchaeota archaeon]|nr:hypothetical protein [Candidatus Woesearchaeota archaeon]